MTTDELKAKGFVQAPDGSWSKPAPGSVGQLGCAVRERDPAPALERRDPVRKAGPCRVGLRIEIVSFRRRKLDTDNDIAGNKPLRDAIARTLGVDDGDPNIRWEYAQVLTKGSTGTLVKLTLTEHCE